MKEVIRIDKPQQTDEKPVEFTHYLSEDGWVSECAVPSYYDKVVYLGKCTTDGDMFAAYRRSGSIFIYKGHLNSGRY